MARQFKLTTYTVQVLLEVGNDSSLLYGEEKLRDTLNSSVSSEENDYLITVDFAREIILNANEAAELVLEQGEDPTATLGLKQITEWK